MAANDIPPDVVPISAPVSAPVVAAELPPTTIGVGAAAAETHPADEYDIPWKEAIEGAFPEFMAFYFPDAHDAIDWAQGHEFLDKELHQVVRDGLAAHRVPHRRARVHACLWLPHRQAAGL